MMVSLLRAVQRLSLVRQTDNAGRQAGTLAEHTSLRQTSRQFSVNSEPLISRSVAWSAVLRWKHDGV